MAVAPSFQSFKIVSEIYTKESNGKEYVKVKNPKTGTVREVRWYSHNEFAKAYGKKLADETIENPYGGLKQARGFSKGPILVVRKNKPSDEEWLKASPFRFAVDTGWYLSSDGILPEDFPSHFKFLTLTWDEFAISKEIARSPQVVAKILDEKEKKGLWIDF